MIDDVIPPPLAPKTLAVRKRAGMTPGHPISAQTVPDGPVNVFMLTEVVNQGSMPSILRGYQLELEVNGSVFNGTRLTVPKTVTLPANSDTYLFHDSDSLFVRTTEHPVPVGGFIGGLAAFTFPNLRLAASG